MTSTRVVPPFQGGHAFGADGNCCSLRCPANAGGRTGERPELLSGLRLPIQRLVDLSVGVVCWDAASWMVMAIRLMPTHLGSPMFKPFSESPFDVLASAFPSSEHNQVTPRVRFAPETLLSTKERISEICGGDASEGNAPLAGTLCAGRLPGFAGMFTLPAFDRKTAVVNRKAHRALEDGESLALFYPVADALDECSECVDWRVWASLQVLRDHLVHVANCGCALAMARGKPKPAKTRLCVGTISGCFAPDNQPTGALGDQLMRLVHVVTPNGTHLRVYATSQVQPVGDLSCLARACAFVGSECDGAAQSVGVIPADSHPLLTFSEGEPAKMEYETSILATLHTTEDDTVHGHAELLSTRLGVALLYLSSNTRPAGFRDEVVPNYVATVQRRVMLGAPKAGRVKQPPPKAPALKTFLPDATAGDVTVWAKLCEFSPALCFAAVHHVGKLSTTKKRAWLNSYRTDSAGKLEWPPLNDARDLRALEAFAHRVSSPPRAAEADDLFAGLCARDLEVARLRLAAAVQAPVTAPPPPPPPPAAGGPAAPIAAPPPPPPPPAPPAVFQAKEICADTVRATAAPVFAVNFISSYPDVHREIASCFSGDDGGVRVGAMAGPAPLAALAMTAARSVLPANYTVMHNTDDRCGEFILEALGIAVEHQDPVCGLEFERLLTRDADFENLVLVRYSIHGGVSVCQVKLIRPTPGEPLSWAEHQSYSGRALVLFEYRSRSWLRGSSPVYHVALAAPQDNTPTGWEWGQTREHVESFRATGARPLMPHALAVFDAPRREPLVTKNQAFQAFGCASVAFAGRPSVTPIARYACLAWLLWLTLGFLGRAFRRFFPSAVPTSVVVECFPSTHLEACFSCTRRSPLMSAIVDGPPPDCVCGCGNSRLLGEMVSTHSDGIAGLRPMLPVEAQLLSGLHVYGGTTLEGVRTLTSCVLSAAQAAKAPLGQQQSQDVHATFLLRAKLADSYLKRAQAALSNGDPHDAFRKFTALRLGTRRWSVARPLNVLVTGGHGTRHVSGTLRPLVDDHRFVHERDPLAASTNHGLSVDDVYTHTPYELWQTDAVTNQPPSPTPVDVGQLAGPCPGCGVHICAARRARNAFCRKCAAGRVCAARPHPKGPKCGHCCAYGKCAVCQGGVTRDIVRSAASGTVGPVVPRVVAIPPFAAPPTTLVKNHQGNPEALPAAPTHVPVMVRSGARSVAVSVAEHRPKVAWAANRKERATPDVTRGAVCVGPCAPAIPVVTLGDTITNRATVNGRLLPYMPDPAPGAWDELWLWTERNWDTIFGGPRPFVPPMRLPPVRSERGAAVMLGWAKHFTPASKAAAKMRGASKLLERGVTPEDLVLRGSPKIELLQCASKTFRKCGVMPAVAPSMNCILTMQSTLACQRQLRYYPTAVVDALFGPHCSMAYKQLCACWSGNHFLRVGGSRKNEDVASFFEALDTTDGLESLSTDYTLFDNSHGAEAHAFFFRLLRRAGFFNDPLFAEVWAQIFPQKVSWPGVGTFEVLKGMASGATWTTIMNTVLNALITTFIHHKARAGSTWARQRSALAAFVASARYSGTHSGDDGCALGLGLRSHASFLTAEQRRFGYSVKVEFSTTFLGCDPIPCDRWTDTSGWQRAYLMVPQPHRELVTLGWSQKQPTHPTTYLSGVGLGWAPTQGHLPVYRHLVRKMAACDGSLVGGPLSETPTIVPTARAAAACASYSGKWAEYSAAFSTRTRWRCNCETLPALSRAWGVSENVILAADADMAEIAGFPCYIGTPAIHAIMASVAG